MQSMKKQSGFTLVEIAIVLVIIGLLLGGILKGQELIENSRTKNVVNDVNGVRAALNSYVDRYRQIPGDDGPLATLQGRGGPWTNITAAGDADGLLEITAAQTFTGAGEAAAFWQHVKAAGFIGGNPNDAGAAALPRNAFGGLTGVTAAGVTGMAGNRFACFSQIPGKAAAAIDRQLDDGVPNAGSVQVTTSAAGTNTAPGTAAATYVETAFYTLCVTL